MPQLQIHTRCDMTLISALSKKNPGALEHKSFLLFILHSNHNPPSHSSSYPPFSLGQPPKANASYGGGQQNLAE